MTVIPPSFQGKVAKCQHRNVETDQHKYFCSQTTVTTGHLAGQGGLGVATMGKYKRRRGSNAPLAVSQTHTIVDLIRHFSRSAHARVFDKVDEYDNVFLSPQYVQIAV